jgi:hypothetical protein
MEPVSQRAIVLAMPLAFAGVVALQRVAEAIEGSDDPAALPLWLGDLN